MVPTEFTPYSSLAGGVLIGIASVLLMALKGRIAGISGIAACLVSPYQDRETAGRFAFIAGLIAAPLLYMALTARKPEVVIEAGGIMLVLSGLLVGFGSVLGSGCTSGHGVCGLARFSKRSMAAVATFMATAAVTVFILRHGL